MDKTGSSSKLIYNQKKNFVDTERDLGLSRRSSQSCLGLSRESSFETEQPRLSGSRPNTQYLVLEIKGIKTIKTGLIKIKARENSQARVAYHENDV